jgi:Immunoglobulin-like domain of bacterial spore germination
VIKVNGGEIYETHQTTDEYERFLPAISVQSPTIGETVSSPVAISGSANVFEATVSLRILDESGREIARGFTTATCGTGCRGTYSTTLSYNVDHEQSGTVEVFESSAKDGSPINVVSIPVTLTT